MITIRALLVIGILAFAWAPSAQAACGEPGDTDACQACWDAGYGTCIRYFSQGVCVSRECGNQAAPGQSDLMYMISANPGGSGGGNIRAGFTTHAHINATIKADPPKGILKKLAGLLGLDPALEPCPAGMTVEQLSQCRINKLMAILGMSTNFVDPEMLAAAFAEDASKNALLKGIARATELVMKNCADEGTCAAASVQNAIQAMQAGFVVQIEEVVPIVPGKAHSMAVIFDATGLNKLGTMGWGEL